MKPVRAILISFAVFVCLFYVVSGRTRWRRSLPELGEMIKTATGRPALDFNGYGNWCGFGGTGDPVDSIDRCCKTHDLCYDAIAEDVCKSLQGEIMTTYTTYYNWTLYQGHITCNDTVSCNQALCECDKAATQCFALNIGSYNESNRSPIGKFLAKILTI